MSTPDVPPALTAATPQKPTKKTTSPKPTNTATALTDDEKRLARNAALREWRKKNKDRVQAYMAEWRAKRSASKPEKPVQPSATTLKSAAQKPASKKTKPSKAAKKSKAKKGGKA
jgi:hypothetical protein